MRHQLQQQPQHDKLDTSKPAALQIPTYSYCWGFWVQEPT